MFEAAIFDWDGTLADTRRAIVVSFRKALGEVGVVVPDEYVERRIGIGAALTFREILKSKGMVVDEEIVERLVRRKSEVQIKLAGEVRLFEGARELLESLQGKIKVGLASMNNRSVIEHILRINHLEGCFEVVVTADDVSRSKPNPEIFLKSAQELNATPSRCIVFEDSVFGVQAAKAGDMGCIAVSTGVYSSEELAKEKPNLIVKSLKDPKIIPFVLQ